MKNSEIFNLVFTLGLLYYLAGTNVYGDIETNIKAGLIGCGIVLMLEGALFT
jgi:hypothetical protein